ncbi:histidine ammonia-lyase [Holotrichia oblita]|nr:histidine ammonia-lyase [Holotrichia oblita]
MINIDGESLRIEDVVMVSRFRERICLTDEAKKKINLARARIDDILESKKPVYGISTGFGEFAKIFISPEEREVLQRNLILSHATGVGEYLPEDIVRAAMLLRVNSLSKGYSGIRLSTVDKLIELINNDIYPAVPCKGSVGASGDLAPLSHIALVLLGEGLAIKDGCAVSGAEVLAEAGIEPITLASKEGLALINGTQIMTAIAALVCHDAANLFKVSDIAAALSLEALQGTLTAFDMRISETRPHKGQADTSRNILKLTGVSQIIESHADCDKVQDAYSLRCIPAVHGASKDALRRAVETVVIEMNSATDNPLVIPETGEIISCGNFHGQPIALVMDYLKTAIAEIGNISERRVNRMMDSHLSGLPAFLTAYPGVNSGLMITQYTAASLVSENKVLAHPASVDSIPTSANQEDHVSMGTIAARQAAEILVNVTYIIAIEMLAAIRGIEFLKPLEPGCGTSAAFKFLRSFVPYIDEDRIPARDINMIFSKIQDRSLLHDVEQVTGELSV